MNERTETNLMEVDERTDVCEATHTVDAFDRVDVHGNRIWMLRKLPSDAMQEYISEEQYQADRRKHLTSTELRAFLRCPTTVYDQRMGFHETTSSWSMNLGILVHALVLEPHTFDQKYQVSDGPINAKTGKPYDQDSEMYRQWAAAQSKMIIRPEDYELAKKMELGVFANDTASELLVQPTGVAESVLRAQYCGLACQIKMDWSCDLARPTIVDLKTCSDLDAFAKWDWKRFLYANQLAFYRSVYTQAHRKSPAFPGVDVLLIAVESQYPFRCGVFEIGDLELDDAAIENEQAIAEMTRCIETDCWPTRFEETRTLGRVRQQPVQEFDACAGDRPYATDETTKPDENTGYGIAM